MPFLSLFLLRESTSVNVATFHAYAGFSPSYELGSRVMRGHAARLHGRIAVSAAARHFIDRFFPGDYKVIPNGVDVPRYRERGPDRALAGRHAEPPVRRPARAAQGPAGPAQGPADPAQDRLRHATARRGLRATGTRSAALRGHARPPGGRLPRSRDRRREGPAVPDRRHLRLAGDRRRIVRHRPARGDGRRDADRAPRTSTATRASSGVGARASSSHRATRRAWPRRSPACSTTRTCGRRWARPARRGPRTSAGRGSRPRSRSTTASSSAGSPRPATLPSGFHAEIPQAPPPSGPGRPRRRRASPHVELPPPASRQTQVE